MKSVFNHKLILAAGLAVLGLAAPVARAFADDDAIVPSKTTVMLLPVLDQTGGPTGGDRFAGLHEAIANHRMEYEFISRQFNMIGPGMSTAAAQKAGINVTDPALRNSDTLKKIGATSGADWVVSVDVLEYAHDSFQQGNRTDHVKLHLLVVNAKDGSVLADKDVLKTKNSEHQNIGVLGLMIATLDYSTKEAFKNLLDDYPATVKVDNEMGTDDYLLGQTKPIMGDPKKTFTDLSTPAPSTQAVQVH